MQLLASRSARGQPVAAAPSLRFRDLYASALEPEGHVIGHGLTQWLRGLPERSAAAGPGDLSMLHDATSEWADGMAARFRGLLAVSGDAQTCDVLVRRAALGCAPHGRVSGAWLQWLTSPGNADDPTALSFLRLYAADVGVGQPRRSRGDAYLALLRSLRLGTHAVPAARLALDHRIPDWCFELPATLLAMSRLPHEFMPEVAGADLCLRAAGLLAPLALVKHCHPEYADWAALDPAAARPGFDQGEPSRDLAASAVASLISHGAPEMAARVAAGWQWALAKLQDVCSRLHDDLDAARDPSYEMAELLALRAREGRVYHRAFLLGGRTLSDWFAESRDDSCGLLAALAASSLVKPGRSGASPLVNGLMSERGPMFRVFAPEDLTVIRRWIDSLPCAQPAPPGRAVARQSSPPPGPHARDESPDPDPGPASLRDAYHALQGRAESPALRRYAEAYIEAWLARARSGIDDGEIRLPAVWQPTGLRAWLAEQYERHDQEFQAITDASVPDREALIDSVVQQAPLTLIDGSWLQGYTEYAHASSEHGHFLFQTYWDELGNGELALNHPIIYRQVLREMDVVLPPTGSAEFARWPGFRDRSFELPVYWLSIGRYPVSRRPEILGLNLAMELSGVGGSYRRAHIALKHHGFSTRFVDIHNTIDNIGAGHSAWAADAVDTYMAEMSAACGAQMLPALWERIRVGFRSLDPPTRSRRRARSSALKRRE